MKTVYISMAVAGGGIVPGAHQPLLGYAASVVGHEGDLIESLIKPCRAFTDDTDMKKYHLCATGLEREGKHPFHAMQRLRIWLAEMCSKHGDEIVLVGYAGERAWSFLVHTYLEYGQPENRLSGEPMHPFGAAPIDITSYAMGKLGCKREETGLLPLCKRFEIQPVNLDFLPGKAQWQAKLFAALLAA